MPTTRYTAKNYLTASSLEEAYLLNQKKMNAIVAGTLWLRMEGRAFDTLIDLSGLGLNQIEEKEDFFLIGCMTSLRAFELHEGLNRCFSDAPRDAVKHIVGTQFRNCATVGGSVWGRFGFSDLLTLLLALDASVILYHGGEMPLAKFVFLPKDNDILTHIRVPKPKGEALGICYESVRLTATDFPLLAVAANALPEKTFLSVGARPGRAMRITLPPVTQITPKQAAELAAKAIPCGGNMRADAAYRAQVMKVLIKRAVEKLSKGEESR